MAYDRATVATKYVAERIKADNQDQRERELINFILAVLDEAEAGIGTKTVAQWKTLLDNAITKGIAA